MENDISALLKKPLWQMTGEEFVQLSNLNSESNANQAKTQYAYGMRALGDALGCSLSTVFELKKCNVLNEAIVSFVGRRIVFDVEKARVLADKYKSEQRMLRQSDKASIPTNDADNSKEPAAGILENFGAGFQGGFLHHDK